MQGHVLLHQLEPLLHRALGGESRVGGQPEIVIGVHVEKVKLPAQKLPQGGGSGAGGAENVNDAGQGHAPPFCDYVIIKCSRKKVFANLLTKERSALLWLPGLLYFSRRKW